MKDGIATLIL